MLRKGRESARVLRRASILSHLDQGQKITQIAGNLGVDRKTVRTIARRYQQEGLDSALHEKPGPGKAQALDVNQSQRIIAMVCGPPPAGHARWSVRLITEEAVKRKLTWDGKRSAETILAFCRTIDSVPESPIVEGDLDNFLNEVRRVLIQRRGARAFRLPRKLNPKQRFQRARPQPEDGEFWMVHRARWLATLVWSDAREEPIWDRALEKAELRRSELRVKMTPKERWEESRKRNAEKSASPPRRRY